MKQFYILFSLPKKLIRHVKISAIATVIFFLGNATANAQVRNYSFAQSSTTYTPIIGTVLGAATGNTATTNLDSNIYPVTLPFSFNLNGLPQTAINVSTNGFITFGSTAPATSNTNPLNNIATYDGAVSAFGRDLSSFFDVSGKSGSISWETVGTAPNREVVVQWDNFRTNSATAVTSVYSFSFQIRLQESTNVIKIIYSNGSYLIGSTAVSGTSQIGLRGNSNLDFNTRLNPATVEFFNSSNGIANNSSQAFNTVNAVPGMPTAGLTYTYTPPTCFPPSSLASAATTGNTANLSWVAAVSSPNSYDVYYSATNTPPNSSTVATQANLTGTSAVVNGLSPSQTYNVWMRSNCGVGGLSDWTYKPIIVRTTCSSLTILSSVPSTICPNQAATLSATATAGSNIVWYNASTGGTILGSGASFVTPSLAATTNYYAAASSGSLTSTVSAAKNTYTAGPSSGSGTTEFGLVFDVLSPFTLKELTVFPVGASGALGTVTIDVVDVEGSVVHSKVVNVSASPVGSPVPQVVVLDFPMAIGTYKIRHSARSTGISGLLFDPSASAPGGNYGYPFVVPNVLSINTGTLTAVNTPRNDLYYYFYDWKIGPACESTRTMVTATVDAACLSTSEIDKKNNIKVYPNPFSDIVKIDRPELVSSIVITDLSGKLIRNNLKVESILRLNDLSSGMYMLLLDMKDGSKQTIKVIKK